MNIMIKKTLGLVVLGTFIVFNTFSQHHKAGLEIDDNDYLIFALVFPLNLQTSKCDLKE